MPKAQVQAQAQAPGYDNDTYFLTSNGPVQLSGPPALAPVLVFPPPSPGSQPPPLIPSFHPDHATSDPLAGYSLLDDLRQAHTHASSPKELVTLHGFPGYLSLNLRRVLARNRTHRSDWALALSCLLFQGLARYAGLPAAQSLCNALADLDNDDLLSATAAEQIEAWRRGFRFTISDPTYSMGQEKRRWKAPEYVHTELHDLSGRLGVGSSTLGVVAIMAALEGQEGVLGEHAACMRRVVAELDERLGERERRLRGLLTAIQAGVWR